MGQHKEARQREAAVAEFVNSATSGDAARFTKVFSDITWPGAWREAFTRLIAGGAVNPTIRPIFIDNWRRMKAQAPTLDWCLERDFDNDLDLMISGLRLLMPPLGSRPAPLVLYRGQRLDDYRAGRFGAWWTLEPTYAEIFARTPSRRRDGAGAVLITFDPRVAIVGAFDGEFLVDPRALNNVDLVDTLSSDLDVTTENLERAYTMAGVPHGLDREGLLQWLDLGMPVEGLPAVRAQHDKRLHEIFY